MSASPNFENRKGLLPADFSEAGTGLNPDFGIRLSDSSKMVARETRLNRAGSTDNRTCCVLLAPAF